MHLGFNFGSEWVLGELFGRLWGSLGELGAPFWDPGLHLEALGALFSTSRSIEFRSSDPESIWEAIDDSKKIMW